MKPLEFFNDSMISSCIGWGILIDSADLSSCYVNKYEIILKKK